MKRATLIVMALLLILTIFSCELFNDDTEYKKYDQLIAELV